jgi:hypothetical protein
LTLIFCIYQWSTILHLIISIRNLSPYDTRVAFFSADAIPAKVELCYDYGYYEGNVEGKSRKCLCGAIGCRNVLY